MSPALVVHWPQPVQRFAVLAAVLLVLLGAAAFAASPSRDPGNPEEASLEVLLSIPIETAARHEQFAGQAPASVTVITAAEIRRYGYRTLAEALQSVRGFYLSDDRNYQYLGIRGFSRPTDYNNRVLLLLNGHRMNENVFGSASIGTDLPLNLAAVERIEVVRGPGSVLYGSSAMLAVVNVITRDGRDGDRLSLSAEGGSAGRKRLLATSGGQTADGLDLAVTGVWGDLAGDDLYFPEYDDETGDGVARNLDWDHHGGILGTARRGPFRAQAYAGVREKGIPTGAFGVTFGDHRSRSLDASGHLDLRYAPEPSPRGALELRAQVDTYRSDGTYPYDEPGDPTVIRERAEGAWLGLEGQYRWDATPASRLIAGMEHREHLRASFRSRDEEAVYFDENFPFRVFSVYAQEEYQARENLSLVFGVRHDAYSAAGSTTTPRGAAVLDLTPSATLKLLYGEAFRAPNLYETSYVDPDAAKANPRLRAERIRTAELVWEQHLFPQAFASASLYRYVMHNLIDQQADPTDGLLQFRNTGEARALGLEVEVVTRWSSGLNLSLQYAAQRAEGQRGQRLSNAPRHLARIGLDRPLTRGLILATDWRWESSRRTLAIGEDGRPITEPSGIVGNLRLTGTLGRVRVAVSVRNLLNTRYAYPGGLEHLQPAIEQDGRTWSVDLGYVF
ncbi:MAG: TonB-dependent receptor [Candidatus Latescibacterota bacterium]|jgi:iron complex outermembrane receptor protein